MKKIRTLLYGLFATAMMAGCSNDDMPVNGGENNNPVTGDGDGYYMTLDIQMPDGKNASRSITTDDNDGGSNSGTEEGQDYENVVNNALLILARKSDDPKLDYGFLAAGEIKSNQLTKSTDGKTYKALTSIEKTNISGLYGDNSNEYPQVYVFVFCNPTKDLLESFSGATTTIGDNTWVDRVCNVIESHSGATNVNTGIWGRGSFLMNNKRITTRRLPKTIEDWDTFDKIEKPFHLSGNNATDYNNPELPDNSGDPNVNPSGAILVERSVARFDFKDGSPLGGNRYHVLYHVHDDGPNENEPLIDIELQRMALVNMSNSFYYLKRVSDNGMPTGANFQLLGAEKQWFGGLAGNYVVGPYATDFESFDFTKEDNEQIDFNKYFNYPFFDINGSFNNSTMAGDQWDVYNISDVIKPGNTMDNYENQQRYYIWRYVTENVIPAGTAKQVNGISTGVVFKGRIWGGSYATSDQLAEAEGETWDSGIHKNLALCLNGDEKGFIVNGQHHDPIKGNSTDDPILYYFDGSLYLTWNHIRQAAIQASISKTNNGVEINRSNSLYRAVFGDGPIPDGQVYFTSKDASESFNDPMYSTPEGKKAYEQSADYAWSVWNAQGKPVNNNPASLVAMRQAVIAQGIAIYQSSIGVAGVAKDTPGYYCYYYYWNRHNDNGKDGVMGEMEFDVVRNNVYKLSVDKISRLGHPRIPENDPDKPTPGTPDESEKVYLDVNVQIVPWTVRVNNINF